MPSPDSPRPEMVKTRLFIVSDTHGRDAHSEQPRASSSGNAKILPAFRYPLPDADVLLHCGDLSRLSRIEEYTETFCMLRSHPAPLKLVIAGNHDLGLDDSYNSRVNRQTVRDIISEAKQDGVHYLEEGNHDFVLANGAQLSVYASPYTPQYGLWAFQYAPGQHEFRIRKNVDIVMTHGPPVGVLDYARSGDNAGCPSLFEQVYKARPKIHCFGHIHEGWGSLHTHWTNCGRGTAINRETTMDRDTSFELGLDSVRPPRSLDNSASAVQQRQRLANLSTSRGMHIDLADGSAKLQAGTQTFFINAAIMDIGYNLTQHPWIVDVNLEKAVDPKPDHGLTQRM